MLVRVDGEERGVRGFGSESERSKFAGGGLKAPGVDAFAFLGPRVGSGIDIPLGRRGFLLVLGLGEDKDGGEDYGNGAHSKTPLYVLAGSGWDGRALPC